MESIWPKYKGLIITLGVVLVLVLIILGCYNYVNNIRNEGIDWEVRQLNPQYVDNQNYLSAFISGFYEQIGVAQAQTSALDGILLDAVKGRYDQGGFGSGSSLFNAIAEAYPDTTQLMANWGKIQDYITAQRAGYRDMQSKLLDKLGAYDNWRLNGFVHSAVVRMLGFPSMELKARIGDQVVAYGPAAEDKMWQIVLTQAAMDAYQSGVMNPLAVPTP